MYYHLFICVFLVCCLTLKGYWPREKKNTLKKSHLSPDPVKRTIGEIEARGRGSVSIRGVLTLLFYVYLVLSLVCGACLTQPNLTTVQVEGRGVEGVVNESARRGNHNVWDPLEGSNLSTES